MENVLVDRLAQYIQRSFAEEMQIGNPESMETLDMIQRLRIFRDEYASAVAISVCERHTISDKQALCLAKCVANNTKDFAGYLRLCPSDVFATNDGEYISE